MKLRILAAAVCVLALCSVSTSFAAPPSQSLGINAGLALPMGDAANAVGMGFFGGGTYTYKLNEQFGVGGDVNYITFGKKNDVDLKFHMLQFGAHGKYYFPMKGGSMAPYAKVGLGMYNVSETMPSYDFLGVTYGGGSASESKMGFSLGAGTTMKLNDKASWGLEAVYHMIQTSGSSTSMFTLGASYNFALGK